MIDLIIKIDTFLITEAVAVKLTPYAKSYIRYQEEWTKEELNSLVDKLMKNAGDFKYEVSFAKGKEKSGTKGESLIIYRKGDDVVRHKMSGDDVKNFKKEITGLIKGTGLKIVGDGKSADWMSVIVTK